ncbi:hypothetical protein MELB17_01975 [Marinobacter sp. ELB17]|nr:hypothetical protein MELB17_01975 [Marinobacter sp. ELB17]
MAVLIMMMTSLFFAQVISFSRVLLRRVIAGLRRGRDAAGLWLVMLLILFVHPLFGETGDALDSAVWVFEQIGTVSGP